MKEEENTKHIDEIDDAALPGVPIPEYDLQTRCSWWDETLDASMWASMPYISAQRAAALLCGLNPLKDQPVDSITTSQTNPYDHKKLQITFETVSHAEKGRERTLAEWRSLARHHGLTYHPWIEDWFAANPISPATSQARGGLLPDSEKTRIYMQVGRARGDAIVAAITSKGYDPKSLPRHKPGRAGIKSEIKEELMKTNKPLFPNDSAFKNAWDQLSSCGDIRYA